MTAKRACRGFTLVELLVVIAIIAILMAILFPVLNRVREKGRETHCMSNLFQIVQALRMYRADEGTYPSAYDPVTGMGGVNALYPTYIASRGVFVCPDDPMVPGDTRNGYVAQPIILYNADGTVVQPAHAMRDLLLRADGMYMDADGHLPYLNPQTRQWQTFGQMWGDPVFFREHYSSYNLLYNYAGYVNYPEDKSISITKPRPFTLGTGLFTTPSTVYFLTGDNPTFWASWYFWDPDNVLRASGTIDNISGTVSQLDQVQQWLIYDLARQIYWPDFDPMDPVDAPADSQWRLKDDLGRPLWELDPNSMSGSGNVLPGTTGTGSGPNWNDLSQEPYGIPSAVFPGLMNRNAPDNTIVTRCPFHRGVSKVAKDIVVRLDGSAQLVPGLQGYNWAKQSGLTH